MKKQTNNSDASETKSLSVSLDEINAYNVATEMDTVPKGFRTVKEWGVIWGRSKSAVFEKLDKLIQLKLFEQKRFKVMDRSGRPHWIRYWRMIKKQ